MSTKEIESNKSQYVYIIYTIQIHANKYIEQLSNKPPTTSIREYRNRANERTATRTFYIKSGSLKFLCQFFVKLYV